ncbi:MAG: hypothetical protein ACXWTX_05815 [Gallionella sp.]
MSSSPKANLFNPADWYSLASWLYDTSTSSSEQCVRRTIISRAYYAALICARDATKSNTIGQDGHVNVVKALTKKSSFAGNKLNSLRLKRHAADYRLDEVITPMDVSTSLKSALAVLSELGQAPQVLASQNKPYSDDYLDSSKFISNKPQP